MRWTVSLDGPLLRTGAAAAGVSALAVGAGSSAAAAGRSVAILGGGVAGLSAAHELAERGFAVTVYERKSLGGKARSIPVPDSATGDRLPLPGEHGFRFFPGFYHNLTDNMRRTPFPGNANGTWDNLTRATTYLGARSGGRADLTLPFLFPMPPRPAPYTPESFLATLTAALETGMRLPPDEAAFFARKLLVYATSSDARRLGQWEKISWNEHIRADQMSYEYQRMLGDGMIRNLAAMKSADASAHSIGLVGEVTLWSALGRGNERGASVDRVLDGSTSEVWLDPWIAHLRRLGVRFEMGWAATALRLDGARVSGVTLTGRDGQTREVSADWVLSAMPQERFARLVTADLLAADPALAGVLRLRTDWMNGLMFYLREELPLTPGHVNYVDSPWAITSISQAQFWVRDFTTYGDGTVAESFSTILSDWVSPGTFNGKAAKDCTPAEIATETWKQIQAHLNDTGEPVLTDDMLHSWFLDPAIIASGTPQVTNDEPLFIQHVDSWKDRPDSRTGIGNLFLAGDWVRTDINVTTMEGANEGARQAVNALLDAAGSTARRCTIATLFRPPEFEAFKRADEQAYRLGLPNAFDIVDPRTP
ncbi:MAG: hydroxysqualene dehydroxylase [Micromonosporaceae bacterium]